MISRTLSVTEVNRFIKTLLDNNAMLKNLMIDGEISNLKFHTSGHIYFSLKDSTSTISCVMFRSDAERLKFVPEEGMQVTLKGRVAVYEKGGRYQIYARSMEPSGIGALYQAFEQRKAHYEALGWLDISKKKEIPSLIDAVGIVTSPTGAAIRDMISVIQRRNPLIKIILYPSLVQGEGAAENIAQGIEAFNTLKNVDVIIVGRGGGSIEDLWAFNEEAVGQAIHDSIIPVISAVGHETDFTIADFVADLRAPTPSAAGELVAIEKEVLADGVDRLEARITAALMYFLDDQRDRLQGLSYRLSRLTPQSQIDDMRLHIDVLSDKLSRQMAFKIASEKSRLESLKSRINSLNPEGVLKRGYAIASEASGRVIASAQQAREAGRFILKFADGEVVVSVQEGEKNGS